MTIRIVLCILLGISLSAFAQKAPKGFEKVDQVIKMGTLHGKLQYDKTFLSVKPGAKIRIEFKNTDEMAHNIVICKIGTDTNKVGMAALKLGADGLKMQYIPKSDKILFHTPLVDSGKTYNFYFQAPKKNGAYPFVCTFPGHFQIMKGTLQVGPAPGKHGELANISYRYYEFSGDKLPDFTKMKPKKLGSLKKMTINIPGKRKDKIAMVYNGNLKIAKAGSYQITAQSDDGMRILLDGKKVWEHDGVHGEEWKKSSQLKLPAGTYAVEVQYFNGTGGAVMAISFNGTGLKNTTWTEGKSGGNKSSGYTIAVTDRPRIYRTGLTVSGLGKGAYSIAVGMPGTMNYCFDAKACFVRAMWSGGFVDAKKDWAGRGGNGGNALGNVFYKNDKTFPLEFSGIDATNVRYDGYRLIKGYPTFMFTVGGTVKVMQSLEVNTSGDGVIQKFTIEGAPGTVKYKNAGGTSATSNKGKFVNNVLTLTKSKTISFDVEVKK